MFNVVFRKRTITIAVLLLTTALPPFGHASGSAPSAPPAATQTSEATRPDIPTLEAITVIGRPEPPLTGSNTLDRATLEHLPAKNGSINEAISVLPKVQSGEGQRSSENAGEILPPLISISGGRAYENNLTVDGANQTSIHDPMSGNNVAESIREVPSHPQRSFIHRDLLDSITVYDSNIPAKFGGFLGGVIDAKTRLPRHEFGVQANFRATRDSWTRIHIDPERKDDFKNSNDQNIHPRFHKYDYGLEVDMPLNEEMGLLAAYKLIRSDLEIYNIDKWKQNQKTLENYFVKFAWTPTSPYTLELTVSHTPSREDFFIDGARNSDIEIERGGYSLTGKLTGDFSHGTLEMTAAYLAGKSSREAVTDHYYWPSDTPSRNWGELYKLPWSAEGGYGNIDNTEESLQLHLDFAAKPLTFADVTHTFNFGLATSHDEGGFDRGQTTYEHALNRTVKDTRVICGESDPSCISNEVYFRERRAYLAESQDARINSYAAYVDDLIRIGPLSFRPGVRMTYDDYMENWDTAYRFAGSWDLFRNAETVLKGGINRYYGQPLLTYKLREGRTPYQRQNRSRITSGPDINKLTEWAPSTDESMIRYRYPELDTPYSDEWNLGVAQKILGGTFEISYLERDNHDQFAKNLTQQTINGSRVNVWELNNNGSSNYRSTTLSWERQWLNHYLNINYTNSDQDQSNESYDDTFDEDDLEDSVWYGGQLISLANLPRTNFNREHVLNIVYTGRLPWNVTFTNIARYQSGYEGLEDTKKDITLPSGKYDIYARVEHPDFWVFDWRFDWEKNLAREQSVVLSLEIDNVFDRTPPSGAEQDIYELGRQFWLGMTYKF